MSGPDAGLTADRFLGGRLTLLQPRAGYRAGIDAVLLAAAVPARPGDRVLELGCGAGAALLCLGVRVPGCALTGLEIQPAYADLARRNADAAGIAARIVDGDAADPPRPLRQESFDHVLANPPYLAGHGRPAAADAGRETARGGGAMGAWIATATRRLAPGGTLTLIQRMARLPEVLAAAGAGLGAAEVLPIAARAGRAPGLFILRARKDRRTPFRLHPALVLHPGDSHAIDGGVYRPEVEKVLQTAAPLPHLAQSSRD